MRNFQDISETQKWSFTNAFSLCMTLNLWSEAEIEMHVMLGSKKSVQLQGWIGNSQSTESEIFARLIFKGLS